MDGMTRDDLKALLETRHESCISLYLPTYRAGADVQQNPIRLKNLVKEAEEKLIKEGMRSPDARELLAPARELIGDTTFWRFQSDGLAVFIAPGFFNYYRVPLSFDAFYTIGRRFHTKPLLRVLGRKVQYLILALSPKENRLLQCTADEVHRVEVPSLPKDMSEALGQEEAQKQLQFHTGTRSRGGGGERPAIFHGHGVGSDDSKDRLIRYFRAVDKGLFEHLKTRKDPLILAGVEQAFSLYREVNSYGNLLEEGIPGNPDDVRDEELRDRGWEILRPLVERQQREAAEQYQELRGSGRASDDLKTVLRAAFNGRVDKLFVAVGVREWGRYDPQADDLTIVDADQPTSPREDLLDLAAAQTFLTGGTIFAVTADEVPGNAKTAAIFRY